ncbi:hypothetical protein EUGRSUZ_H02702 [Eucalyptus grandis]|uniref:Uncharacterized protein n=2 Tax=Eucalyptus grandis TaxID=71139 RepID=A0ACC3JS97_EUCGR|nr:hypothetical protein EUGRSUZ_H02702 [Eucalyptus grandis]
MKGAFAESSGTSASAVAESFAEDIVIEILLRLPVKSLGRFKCVCKGWRSLISDRGFAKSHLERLKAGDIISSQRIFKTSPFETIDYELLDGGIGGEDDRAVVKFHEPRMDDSSWPLELVGSCDGLVCLSVMGYSGFVLYNPTTKECRNLPVQRKKWDGFEDQQVVIFSLKSGSWRTTQAKLESHLSLYERGDGVYWKGALHWCGLGQGKQKTEDVIISFDLSEEKFQQVLRLPEDNGDMRFEGLGVHGANLFVYHGSYKDCFQAWITSEYGKGGSWTKLYNVTTEGISGYSFWRKIPVAYTKSGKIVFQVDVYRTIMFNPEDNTYKDYPIQRHHDVESTIYMETLISPYLDCEPSRI